MLAKTALHAKWICFSLALIVAFIWTQQERKQDTTEPERNVPVKLAAMPNLQTESAALDAAAQTNAAVPAPEPKQVAAQTERMYKFTPNTKHDLSQYTAVEVVATGYYAGKESTGKTPGHPEYGVTRSGIKVLRDDKAISTIAADPAVFPMGTVLYIPGYGYGVVADTGSAVKGNRIDLYFETKDQVFKEWGKRTVKVFVVKKGEGKVTETLLHKLKQEILSIGSAEQGIV